MLAQAGSEAGGDRGEGGEGGEEHGGGGGARAVQEREGLGRGLTGSLAGQLVESEAQGGAALLARVRGEHGQTVVICVGGACNTLLSTPRHNTPASRASLT